jgi:hypothetical protein
MNIEQFNEAIDALWTETKAGLLPREMRFKVIEELTDNYIETSGNLPDTAQLDRLATLCLYEEVTDSTPWKTRNNEYPIHSDRQQEEIEKNEVNVGNVHSVTRDKPVRRKRSDYENHFVNKKAQSDNAERNKKYREFTKIQPVNTYFR